MTTTATARFDDKLRDAQQRSGSLLCVGLDPEPTRFPDAIGKGPESIAAFNRAIIVATSDIASCYKPNLGFYLRYGVIGIEALAQVRRDVPEHIPVLLDAKFGDLDLTSSGYAEAVFDLWNFDAVTVNAFMGRDSLEPFLNRTGRGIFILAKTSNPGSGLFQDRTLVGNSENDEETLTLAVTRHAVEWGRTSAASVGLVTGATYPAQLAAIRAAAPDMTFLVPGVGAQAGDLESAVRAGLDARNTGLIISASRAICYASSGEDFQDAAHRAAEGLRDQINAARAP